MAAFLSLPVTAGDRAGARARPVGMSNLPHSPREGPRRRSRHDRERTPEDSSRTVPHRRPPGTPPDVHHVDRMSWSLRPERAGHPRRAVDYSPSWLAGSRRGRRHPLRDALVQLDTRWTGVRMRDLLAAHRRSRRRRRPRGDPAEADWTTNLPLAELLADDVLVAYEHEGKPLSADHGGPVRLLVPRLYLWKSAKWLREIEFRDDQRLATGRDWATTRSAIPGSNSGTPDEPV